jgi:hypothetical protein
MQIPFIKYVEALVACKYPVDVIYDKVNQLGVTLSEMFPREAIQQVYVKLVNIAPEYFKSVGAIPDPSWLRELDILKLVAHELKLQIPETTIGITGAFEILKDKNMYEIMTSLALAKVNDEDIELIVNGKYNIHYTHEDIKEFLHYIFNVEDWSLSDKKDYVTVVKDSALKKYYNLALEGDKDYLIWKLGIAPDKSFDTMIRDMGTDAYYNFKEKMRANPDEAQKWGQLLIRLSDRLDRIEKDTDEKRDLFSQVTFVLSGNKEDDLLENVIDGTGTLVKSKKAKRKHISEINNED